MSSSKRETAVGTRFARLVVTGEPYRDGNRWEGTAKGYKYRVAVRCDCGAELSVDLYALRIGNTRSCGCYKRDRMAGSNNPYYKVGGRLDKESWLAAEKANPCVDCSIQYPSYAMQFDHVPERGPKLFEISRHRLARQDRTLDDLMAERLKCDLVCVLCHTRRTNQRANKQPVTLPPWRSATTVTYS